MTEESATVSQGDLVAKPHIDQKIYEKIGSFEIQSCLSVLILAQFSRKSPETNTL